MIAFKTHPKAGNPGRRRLNSGTDADSGHLSGVAPLLIISPYAALVRFVLASSDLDRSVQRTASEIPKALVDQVSKDGTPR